MTEPTSTSARVRTAPLDAAERRHLWWGVPPLVVLALAHLLFDVVGGGYAAIGERLIAHGQDDGEAERVAVLAAAAIGWAAFALAYVLVSVATAAAAWRIMASRVRGRARRPLLAFVAVVAAASLAHLFVVDRLGWPLHGIFGVTLAALVAEPAVSEVQATTIRFVVAGINVMSAIVPALFLAAAIATTLPPRAGWNPQTLARRAQQIRRIVAVAAGFMVVGVLHMGAWTQLAGATLGAGADHALDLVAVAVTLYWGTAFTLMIASFYLPMGLRLAELAETVMDERGVDMAERRQWLAARGLSFEPSQQLPQIAAVAAPLLAGPVSGALGAAAERLTA